MIRMLLSRRLLSRRLLSRHVLAAAACSLVLVGVSGRVSAMLDAPGEAMALVFTTALTAPIIAMLPAE